MRTTRNSTGSPLHGQSTPQATGAMYTNRAWLTHFHALTGDLEELAGGHQAVGFVDFGGEEAVWPGARNGLAHSSMTSATSFEGSKPRIWMALAAVRISIPMTAPIPSMARRSLRAADHPIETWSSCMAEVGMESTEAGTASRFMSETMPA